MGIPCKVCQSGISPSPFPQLWKRQMSHGQESSGLPVLPSTCHFSFRWWNNLIRWVGNYQDPLTIHIFTSQAKVEISGKLWSACWELSSIPEVPILILKSKDLNSLLLTIFKTLPLFHVLWEPFFPSRILTDLSTHSGVFLSFQHDRAWLMTFSLIIIVINYTY